MLILDSRHVQLKSDFIRKGKLTFNLFSPHNTLVPS